MTRPCPGRAKQLYVNPNHLQALTVRAAALAQLGRAEEAAEATEVLLSNYPTMTVERHLRNFHWKNPEDLAHYRDGLLKAGVPSGDSRWSDPSKPSPKLLSQLSATHRDRSPRLQLTRMWNSAKLWCTAEVARRRRIQSV